LQDFQDIHDLDLDTSSLLDMEEEDERGTAHQLDLSDIDTAGMDNAGLDLTDLENFILHDSANQRIFYGKVFPQLLIIGKRFRVCEFPFRKL
jgi:hypothetical protein